MRFKFWGVRGSVPSGNRETGGVGGNTTCLEVRCGQNLFIFDSGTGIRNLGNSLLKQLPVKAKLFYSHVHWDHIQGLPFFTPLYIKGCEIEIYGGSSLPISIEQILRQQMSPPWFPVKMDIMAATKKFYDLRPGDEVTGDNYKITLASLYHPDSCYAYRVDSGGKSLVFATDTEHYEDKLDENLLNLSQGADILIYDCQFTPAEYHGLNGQMPRKGWGHSTMQEGAKLARAAGVKHLILFHHDPTHNDEFIKKLEIEARELFPNSAAAYEGMEMDLDSDPAPRSMFQ